MLRRSPRDCVRGRGLSRPSVVALLVCLWSALLGATGLAPAGAADGQITQFSIPTADSGPHCLTVGPDGNLWFAELFGDNIARMTLSGQITEFPVPTYNSYPAIITLGPDGNLWFTEWLKDKIGRITPSG